MAGKQAKRGCRKRAIPLEPVIKALASLCHCGFMRQQSGQGMAIYLISQQDQIKRGIPNYLLHISGSIHYNGAMDIVRCYEILEVEPDASLDEVKQVYKDLVCVWHPDRFSHNPRLRKRAEEKLKKLVQVLPKIILKH